MEYMNMDITKVVAPAIIIHGVNCAGSMGSGVAKALYEKWPAVKERYLSLKRSEMVLGTVQALKVDSQLYVINCFTQQTYGRDGRVYADPKAIKMCLEEVAAYRNMRHITDVYAPKIGCGFGGLNWDEVVAPIFQDFAAAHRELRLIVCTQGD